MFDFPVRLDLLLFLLQLIQDVSIVDRDRLSVSDSHTAESQQHSPYCLPTGSVSWTYLQKSHMETQRKKTIGFRNQTRSFFFTFNCDYILNGSIGILK